MKKSTIKNVSVEQKHFKFIVFVFVLIGLLGNGCGGKKVLKTVESYAAAKVVTTEMPPAYQPQTQIHQILPGDTLWAISYKKMGSSFLWPILWKENRDYVVDPDWIEAGENLELPEGWSSEDLDWAVKLAAERPSKPAGRSFQGAK